MADRPLQQADDGGFCFLVSRSESHHALHRRHSALLDVFFEKFPPG
jgi:hypothetical protein